MNITMAIQIGNTDNKLIQQKWSEFITTINNLIADKGITVHFSGGSSYDKPWQNACWVIETTILIASELEKALKTNYDQNYIAITLGTTTLI